MKAIFAAAAALVTTLAVTSGANAKEVYPSVSPAGAWVYIGTTHAKHMNDHDSLVVSGQHTGFRAIKVKVTGAPLHMQRMMVTYGNGEPENIPIRFNIPQGGESRTIDLHGGKRMIRQIDFWYDTKGWFKGTADVSVYGVH